MNRKAKEIKTRRDNIINLFLDDSLYGTSKIDAKLKEREGTLDRCNRLIGFYIGDIIDDVEQLKSLKPYIDDDKEKRKRNEKVVCHAKRKKSLRKLMEWSFLKLEFSVGKNK